MNFEPGDSGFRNVNRNLPLKHKADTVAGKNADQHRKITILDPNGRLYLSELVKSVVSNLSTRPLGVHNVQFRNLSTPSSRPRKNIPTHHRQTLVNHVIKHLSQLNLHRSVKEQLLVFNLINSQAEVTSDTPDVSTLHSGLDEIHMNIQDYLMNLEVIYAHVVNNLPDTFFNDIINPSRTLSPQESLSNVYESASKELTNQDYNTIINTIIEHPMMNQFF